jgi:8-oxo-dGTP pyrophosphatase MutT (NUDIX family)
MDRVEQAGAIPFTVVDGTPRVLLVTAKHSPTDWIFPKGHIEAGETAEQAAVRELSEEAGVHGRAIAPAGTLQFRSVNEDVRVHYYFVRYDGEPAGGEPRARKLFDLDAAIAALAHPDAKRLLANGRSTLERLARTS